MTRYTTPDRLPSPDDYQQPGNSPAVLQQLADATQAALLTRDGRLGPLEAALGGLKIRGGVNVVQVVGTNPVTIQTGLGTVVGCFAANGDPSANPGQVTAVNVDAGAGIATVYHTFVSGGARVNWIAIGH
jgi:hypothetical protein